MDKISGHTKNEGGLHRTYVVSKTMEDLDVSAIVTAYPAQQRLKSSRSILILLRVSRSHAIVQIKERACHTECRDCVQYKM